MQTADQHYSWKHRLPSIDKLCILLLVHNACPFSLDAASFKIERFIVSLEFTLLGVDCRYCFFVDLVSSKSMIVSFSGFDLFLF